MKRIEIWTDGSCNNLNKDEGMGWGYLLKANFKGRILLKAACNFSLNVTSTSQRAEILAAVAALAEIRKPSEVILHSDSEYLVRMLSGRYKHSLHYYHSHGYKKKENSQKELANADLWKTMHNEYVKHSIKALWIKGHDKKLSGNTIADSLASYAREKGKPFFITMSIPNEKEFANSLKWLNKLAKNPSEAQIVKAPSEVIGFWSVS